MQKVFFWWTLHFWTPYTGLNCQVLIEQISPDLRCKKSQARSWTRDISVRCWYIKVPILIHQSVHTNRSWCFWVLTFGTFAPAIDSRFLPKCLSQMFLLFLASLFCTFLVNIGFLISPKFFLIIFPPPKKKNIHSKNATAPHLCKAVAVKNVVTQGDRISFLPEAHCLEWPFSRMIQVSSFRSVPLLTGGVPHSLQSNVWTLWYYCWWLKSCTTWDVWNPINNGINYLSTGAGFQPSTVVIP